MITVPTLTVPEAHDGFIAFEEETGLWDATVDGTRYWHQMRYGVFGLLLRALGLMTGERAAARTAPRTWLGHKRDVLASADPRWQVDGLDPADLLVYCHPRSAKAPDGSWHCQYTDPLIRDLPWSRWVVKTAHRGVHAAPDHTPGLKFLDRAVLAAEARWLARGRLPKAIVEARREVARWAPALAARFGVEVDRRRLRALIVEAARVVPSLRSVYARLLDDVRPKAVIQVVGYSSRILPLTELARVRGIPVIEMQHGTIGPTHLAYNFAPGREPPGFPDILAAFGEWWGEITPGLPASCRVVGVGNAGLEAHLPATLRDPSPPADGGPRIALVLSQSSIGAMLSRQVAEAAPALAARGWKARYKFHPAELDGWRARYPWLAAAEGPGLEVLDTPSPIHAELARAHAQVGVYSTALFEGVAYHLPTVIAAIPGHEAMAPLIDAGAARLCPDAADLAAALAAAPAPHPAARARIWQPDARANFAALLDRLLAARTGDD